MDLVQQGTTTDLSTDEAMSRYAGGDDDAFKQLYAAVAPRLRTFLCSRVSDRSRVPDLIQETFLRVHRARRTFRPGASGMPWILTIARHLVIDVFRTPWREEALDLERLHWHRQRGLIDGSPTGEQVLLAREAAVRLDRAFDRLPQGQRAALHLVRTEGLSTAEAAIALGTTAMGVRLRTHKACQRLRAALGCELAAA
jgi:RNA polymerase sigma-70 factor, ECF subfamily